MFLSSYGSATSLPYKLPFFLSKILALGLPKRLLLLLVIPNILLVLVLLKILLADGLLSWPSKPPNRLDLQLNMFTELDLFLSIPSIAELQEDLSLFEDRFEGEDSFGDAILSFLSNIFIFLLLLNLSIIYTDYTYYD